MCTSSSECRLNAKRSVKEGIDAVAFAAAVLVAAPAAQHHWVIVEAPNHTESKRGIVKQNYRAIAIGLIN